MTEDMAFPNKAEADPESIHPEVQPPQPPPEAPSCSCSSPSESSLDSGSARFGDSGCSGFFSFSLL
jgi:hypothetical protein